MSKKRKRIAEGVNSKESQRIIRKHKDSNPTLREKTQPGGLPSGKYDVYIEVEDDEQGTDGQQNCTND